MKEQTAEDVGQDMAPLLAFPVQLRGHGPVAPVDGSPASDAFVLSTLFFLFLLLACLGSWIWAVWRRQTQPKPHQQLLHELDGSSDDDPPEPHTEPTQAREESAAPWEKPADWWKK